MCNLHVDLILMLRTLLTQLEIRSNSVHSWRELNLLFGIDSAQMIAWIAWSIEWSDPLYALIDFLAWSIECPKPMNVLTHWMSQIIDYLIHWFPRSIEETDPLIAPIHWIPWCGECPDPVNSPIRWMPPIHWISWCIECNDSLNVLIHWTPLFRVQMRSIYVWPERFMVPVSNYFLLWQNFWHVSVYWFLYIDTSWKCFSCIDPC